MKYCVFYRKQVSQSSEIRQKSGNSLRNQCSFCGTAAEKILNESVLQRHWLKRVIAILIDSIIVGIAIMILRVIPEVLGIFNWVSLPFMVGFIFVLYFVATESTYGYTMGKKMANLKVMKANGKKPSLRSAFIRNISKIHFFLLLLDTIMGFFASKDNHQRYIEQFSNTIVV